MTVAPFMGAWIEIHDDWYDGQKQLVAPFMGAWIEIGTTNLLNRVSLSHPLWVRGLK